MLNEKQTARLIRAMTKPIGSGTTRTVDAGYTYLGQFIAHEIVTPRDPLMANGHDTTPTLDLDSLYGTAALRARTMQGDLFIIGRTPDGTIDLLRDCAGAAMLHQPRNDENVIVSQLHVFWQRFHNFIRDMGFAITFERARELTTKVFQLVVIEDYLQLLLEPRVFQAYFRAPGQRRLGYDSKTIAPQFGLAAFRFGHSMVRPSYEFGPEDAKLPELFCPGQPLPRRLLIDWTTFFGWPGMDNDVQDAALIDPWITQAMAQLQRAGQTISIVVKNLEAGAGLGPGKAYARTLLQKDPDLAKDFGLVAQDALWQSLADDLTQFGTNGESLSFWSENLPFWPYILNEAVLPPSGGQRLGALGSLICAETLANSIVSSAYCLWPDRRPTGLDAALSSLGALGDCIRKTMATNPVQAPPDETMGRTFCMRHLIELLNHGC